MPRYRWKGRSAAGQELQAETSGSSENAVTSIVEVGGEEPAAPDGVERPVPREPIAERLARARASSKPRPFRGILVASVFFLAALGVGYFAPIVVCTCEHAAGGSVDCALVERDLGLVMLREQHLAGVTAAEVESKTSHNRDSDGRTRYVDYSRLVLKNAAGTTIRPSVWDQTSELVRSRTGRSGGENWVGASTGTMQNEVTSFLMNSPSARMSVWQGQTVPLVMAGVLVGIGLLVLGLSVLGLFAGSTAWVYAVTGRMAAWAEERRRQQGR